MVVDYKICSDLINTIINELGKYKYYKYYIFFGMDSFIYTYQGTFEYT